MAAEFACAPVTLFGKGILPDMIPYIKREGLSRALVVSDRGLEKAGLIAQLCAALDCEGIHSTVYRDVEANPTVDNVRDGLAAYQEKNCDFLISLGGGSPTDCAKAIRVMAGNGGQLSDYKGSNKSKKKGPFYVAVNTTAGTASEISRAFLITDPVRQEKMIFKDDYAMPDIAIDDWGLMMDLPAHITAQTGMDALTHAVEGYLSARSSFLTDLAAKQAISMVARYLPRAVLTPHNEEAREGMIYAQYLAGMSFGNAGLGLVHAMAHPLGAVYNLPHGLCNAVLLPYVLDFYSPSCEDRIAALGTLMDQKEMGDTRSDLKTWEPARMADRGISLVRRLSELIGTNISLKSLGVEERDFTILAQKALQDGCIITSPVMPDQEAVIGIYRKAWEGDKR